jgi:hypothetical protein
MATTNKKKSIQNDLNRKKSTVKFVEDELERELEGDYNGDEANLHSSIIRDQLPFRCNECGVTFPTFNHKIIHEQFYCLKQNRDMAYEKEIMRIRSMDFVQNTFKPGALSSVGPTVTNMTTPRTLGGLHLRHPYFYSYDRKFRNFEQLSKEKDRFLDYDGFILNEHFRPAISPLPPMETVKCCELFSFYNYVF